MFHVKQSKRLTTFQIYRRLRACGVIPSHAWEFAMRGVRHTDSVKGN